MRRAQELRQEIEAVQDELKSTEVEGSSGNSKVVARVNGAGVVTGLTIDPSVIDPSDADLLSDLVLLAIADATRAMGVITEERMGPYAAMLKGV